MSSVAILDAPSGTEIESFTFDVSTERWSEPATVTDHPIENGSQMSDHIQALPRIINVDAVISGSPYRQESESTTGRMRIINAKAFLTKLQPRDGNPPVIVSFISDRLGLLENYAVQSLDYDIDAVEELPVRMVLKEMFFATAEVVTLAPRPAPAKADAKEQGEPARRPRARLTVNQSKGWTYLQGWTGWNNESARVVTE